ncbi:MAG: IspD/TarI family cytidylyltransferase [Bacillota bacterium]
MFSVIILGGGKGERLKLGYNKVLYKIKGKTLLEYAADKFINDKDFSEIIIVIDETNINTINKIFTDKKIKIVLGGINRQTSVYNGLKMVTNNFVIIHDGARPNVGLDEIQKIKENVKKGPCTLYTSVKEATVEMKNNIIKGYINRDKIALIKTPQGFKTTEIKTAYKLANENKKQYTDDASLLFYEMNKEVKLINGNENNIKVTTEFDLNIMEDLL